MSTPLRFGLLLLPVAVLVTTGACGPNVILDGTATGTGAVGAGGSTGTALGGASTTTSFGQGTGGGFSTAVCGGPVTATVGTGGVSVGTSVTAGTGGVTSATSTGTGIVGSCLDGPDAMILETVIPYPTIVNCATANLGNTNGLTKCIKSKFPLSHACLGCVVDDVLCSLKACENVCASDPTSTSCETCRNQSCAAAFVTCSGFPYAMGSLTCNQILTDGVQEMVNGQIPAEAFVTGYGKINYMALESCGCGTKAFGDCRKVCDDALSNGPPDFCNAAPPSAECLSCLGNHCGSELMSCQGT